MNLPVRATTKPSPMPLVSVLLLATFTIEFGIMAFFLDLLRGAMMLKDERSLRHVREKN